MKLWRNPETRIQDSLYGDDHMIKIGTYAVWTLGLVFVSWVSVFAQEKNQTLAEVDIKKFKYIGGKSFDDIIALVGQPAARYKAGDVDYWLYDNAFKEEEGKRKCPELLFEKGEVFQISWIPDEIMKKSVMVAKGFGDWTPPTEIKEKTFTVSDTGVVDKTKSEILENFGSPDVKKVFNGKEVWEYKKVSMGKEAPEMYVTIFLEFEGEKVVSSVGN
jgi:hypothetical protein